MSLVGSVLRSFMERGARNLTLDDLAARLQASSEEVAGRFARAADTPKNREAAAHVIGIERWGQLRLRSALGQPLILDEYERYRPAVSLTMPALHDLFSDARSATLDLIRRLQAMGVSPSTTIKHNDMGELTVRGWLFYLNGHAARESGRVR